MKRSYIDVHCHPALKPYGKSFRTSNPKKNNPNKEKKNSIWFYGFPSTFDKFINALFTLTKFTQSDMTASTKAKTSVMMASLYPLEKHFVNNKTGTSFFSDMLSNLAIGVSRDRINYVQNINNYFTDLEDEYQFYKNLNGASYDFYGIRSNYKLVKNYTEILANKATDHTHLHTINVVITIEGGHAFNCGLKKDQDSANSKEVLENVLKVKNWEHKPLFITLAHHFNNELCGQAESLSGIVKSLASQRNGLQKNISTLGNQVITSLLNNENGKRIYIDIKHMNTISRTRYYEMLNNEFKNEQIPIIVSHGAANGFRSIEAQAKVDFPNRQQYFKGGDINFYDSEFLKIEETKGVFGIQLDERRVGNKKALKKAKGFLGSKKKLLKKRAYMVWRQIEHIAEVLDTAGLNCWNIQCIGSDFDGIINPIKGFWTVENIAELGEYLEVHASEYLKNNKSKLHIFNQQFSAKQIIDKVFTINAEMFLERFFV